MFEALLLPPGGPLLLAVFGLGAGFRRQTLGRRLSAGGLLLLYLAALPLLSAPLLRALERYPALTPQQVQDSNAGAIVILGAGRYAGAPEYGGDTLSSYGLERVRYGAYLQRLAELPVLVSGGSPLGEAEPEAALMARVLRQEFGVREVWQEGASSNTAQNARLSAAELKRRGVTRVLLVTHAWHMARAARMFRQEGIEVIAAPTGFATNGAQHLPLTLLPSAQALADTRLALHEYLGQLWYRLRY